MPSCERFRANWFGEHVASYQNAIKKQARVVLVGDSIVANLSRYPAVWARLEGLKAANCGIRGDRTLNVLWRVERMHLPATTSVGIIHCGINDIRGSCSSAFDSEEIAGNLISCGSKLQDRNPLMSIIIIGILPTEAAFQGEGARITAVNQALQKMCQNFKHFSYVDTNDLFVDSTTKGILWSNNRFFL